MTHLKEWTYPGSYFGASWEGWAPVVGQSRDSRALERSNYAVAYRTLGCEPFNGGDTSEIESDAVDTRCNHWAVGWVETIYVRLGTPTADRAEELLRALADYPVLDDEDFSETEWQEASEWWRNMGLRSRMETCREYGVSIFAARRADEIPDDGTGSLFLSLVDR